MEGTTSTGMYPLHRCKILHLASEACTRDPQCSRRELDFGSYLSNDYLDAHLTDLGWSQPFFVVVQLRLWTREEKEIAIVSHSGFLYYMLNNFGQDCHPVIQQEISKIFANCELRSMVLVDRSI
ncbi:uncharacterized protein LOC144575276 [Carex rostrata]